MRRYYFFSSSFEGDLIFQLKYLVHSTGRVFFFFGFKMLNMFCISYLIFPFAIIFLHCQSWDVVAQCVDDILKDYPRLRLTHGRKVCILQSQNLGWSTLLLKPSHGTLLILITLIYVFLSSYSGFRGPTCDKLG